MIMLFSFVVVVVYFVTVRKNSFDPNNLSKSIEGVFSRQVDFYRSDLSPLLTHDNTLRLVEVTISQSNDLEFPYLVSIQVTSDQRINSPDVADIGTYLFKVDADYNIKKTRFFDVIYTVHGPCEFDTEQVVTSSVELGSMVARGYDVETDSW